MQTFIKNTKEILLNNIYTVEYYMFAYINHFQVTLKMVLFFYLLAGYTRSFFQMQTPYFAQKAGTLSGYIHINFKKVGATYVHWTTSDVIVVLITWLCERSMKAARILSPEYAG